MSCQQPVSLFETTVSDDQLDPAFVHIRDDPSCEEDRQYINRLWGWYRDVVADPHFFHGEVQRQGNFQTRVWEMRLSHVLADLGLSLSFSRSGPDIKITGAPTVYIEAVAPDMSLPLERNHELSVEHVAPVPEDEVILRYTTVMDTKWKKYLEYREKGVVGPADCYVIAVSGANLPFPEHGAGIPWILKPLYGVGSACFRVSLYGDDADIELGYHHAPIRRNANQSPVEAALFCNKEWSGISAVLFSPNHIKNRPTVHGQPEGADLVTCRNHSADNPLPQGFIRYGREWGVLNGKLQLLADWRKGPGADEG